MNRKSIVSLEITLPRHVVEVIDFLVKSGVYRSRSEAASKLIQEHIDLVLEGIELEENER
jgi:Arc/MetJ-type ribon-helix-helix transcriptional regulator